MVCVQCGTEFYEGIYCPECGTKYSAETEKKSDIEGNENQFGQQNQEYYMKDDVVTVKIEDMDIKVPWYFRMWFLSLIYWIGGMICIGPIIAIVLFTLRISKYPNARKNAWISAGIQLGISALLAIMLLV